MSDNNINNFKIDPEIENLIENLYKKDKSIEKDQLTKFVYEFFETIKLALIADDRIEIRGFGSLFCKNYIKNYGDNNDNESNIDDCDNNQIKYINKNNANNKNYNEINQETKAKRKIFFRPSRLLLNEVNDE